MTGPWRELEAITEDYPGLIVHDGRVTGSITFGHSRLPLWAVSADVIGMGWGAGAADHDTPDGAEQLLADFLWHLLNQRGEFARLLCVLADVERTEDRADDLPWWSHGPSIQRSRAALTACLATFPENEAKQ